MKRKLRKTVARGIAAAVTAVLSCSMTSVGVFASEPVDMVPQDVSQNTRVSTWHVGDLNQDGKVDLADAQRALRIALKIDRVSAKELEMWATGDVDDSCDWGIRLDDVSDVLKSALHICEQRELKKTPVGDALVYEEVFDASEIMMMDYSERFATKEDAVNFTKTMGSPEMMEKVQALEEQQFEDQELLYTCISVQTDDLTQITPDYFLTSRDRVYYHIDEKCKYQDNTYYYYVNLAFVDVGILDVPDPAHYPYLTVDVVRDAQYTVDSVCANERDTGFKEGSTLIKSEQEFDAYMKTVKGESRRYQLNYRRSKMDFEQYMYLLIDQRGVYDNGTMLQEQSPGVVKISHIREMQNEMYPYPDPAEGNVTIIVGMKKEVADTLQATQEDVPKEDISYCYTSAAYIYKDAEAVSGQGLKEGVYQLLNQEDLEAFKQLMNVSISDDAVKASIVENIEEILALRADIVYEDICGIERSWMEQTQLGHGAVVVIADINKSFSDGVKIAKNGFEWVDEDGAEGDGGYFVSRNALTSFVKGDKMTLRFREAKGIVPATGEAGADKYLGIIPMGDYLLEGREVELVYPK